MSDILKIDEILPGAGEPARRGQQVSVHYTGWLQDGTKFDSSHDRGAPFRFKLGAGEVILGWDDGVTGMQPGGKRRLTIPPDLAYGRRGVRGVSRRTPRWCSRSSSCPRPDPSDTPRRPARRSEENRPHKRCSRGSGPGPIFINHG